MPRYYTPRVPRTCERCGESFSVKASEALRGKGRFCSRSCAANTPTPCVCRQCGARFTIQSVKPGKGEGKFCSRHCASLSRRRPMEECFWARVQRGGPDECWPWTGPRNWAGYGLFSSRQQSPPMQVAHRVAWRLLIGEVPEGAMLCHRCPRGSDRGCVNPAHLYIGDHTTNMADRDREGRTARGDRLNHPHRVLGERHHMTVLTTAEVIEMRERAARGESIAQLGREYGLPASSAGRIIKRQTWRHV